MRAELHATTVALRAPLRTANGELRERPLLLLELDDGWGEAAPLEPYDGVPVERCRAALEAYLPILTVPLAARLARTVRAHVDGPTLNAALARTGMLQLAFCVLLSAGILAS